MNAKAKYITIKAETPTKEVVKFTQLTISPELTEERIKAHLALFGIIKDDIGEMLFNVILRIIEEATGCDAMSINLIDGSELIVHVTTTSVNLLADCK